MNNTTNLFNIKHAVLAVATAGLLLSALVMPLNMVHAQVSSGLNQSEMLGLLQNLLAQVTHLQTQLNQQTSANSETSISIGDRVRTTDRLRVRLTPGGFSIGVATANTEGTVITGPRLSAGRTWWRVAYDTGLTGWSASSWLVPIEQMTDGEDENGDDDVDTTDDGAGDTTDDTTNDDQESDETWDRSDVSYVESTPVGASLFVNRAQYIMYTVVLKNDTHYEIKACSFCSQAVRDRAFYDSGYRGDVDALIALADKDDISDPTPNPAPDPVRNTEIGISFPPVADKQQRDFALPVLKDLGIRNIRFSEHWGFREPSPGKYEVGPLDDRMDWAEENNFDVFLTIESNGPEWACDPSRVDDISCVYTDLPAFERYIRNLVTRYSNSIDKIQFGNEWQSPYWYKGTAEEFVEAHNILYDAVQDINPDIEVVLGGYSIGALRALAYCDELTEYIEYEKSQTDSSKDRAQYCSSAIYKEGEYKSDYVLEHANYDLIDLHLYDDEQNWPIYYEMMEDRVRKPIIVSEFGGPHPEQEPSDQAYQADKVQSYLETIDTLGIDEAYFFSLVEKDALHGHSSLIDADLEHKQSYKVFKEYTQGGATEDNKPDVSNSDQRSLLLKLLNM